MTIAEEKQAQRTAARAARKALDAPQRAAANAALCRRVLELDAYRAAHILFCSTQPLGAKPTLPPWLPKLSGRARR